MRQDISGETPSVHLSALGVPVVVRASGEKSADLAQALSKAWEWCLNDPPTGHSATKPLIVKAFLDSDEDAVQEARSLGATASSSLEELMHWLTPLVTTRAITARASSLLMMHACALSDPDTGATVLLAGPSGAGKTTVARVLGKSFGYVTDECSAIRDDHTLVPFPKPLSLVTESPSGVKEQASPSSLGLMEPPDEVDAVAVLYLDRQPDAPVEPEVTPVSNVQALGMLCPQVSFVGSRPAPLWRIVRLLDATGGLRRVSYRDAADLHGVVAGLVEAGW